MLLEYLEYVRKFQEFQNFKTLKVSKVKISKSYFSNPVFSTLSSLIKNKKLAFLTPLPP